MNVYSKRRELLAKSLENNSVAIFFSSDNEYDPENGFKVNRNFYYLTGIDARDMALVLVNNNGNIEERIFIYPYDEVEARWVGGRMSEEEVTDISGIVNVLDYSEFEETIDQLMERSRGTDYTFYFDLFKKEIGNSIAITYANKLKEKHPGVDIKDVFKYIANLRLVKDEYEIECLSHAIEITNYGIKAMMKAIRPGLNEMVMEGVFNLALSQNVCNETSFKTIAASGKRATILHYSNNNEVMQDGELFLQDLGATYNHYCADITRTYPVNGKFSDRQKELYEVVLNAQRIVEANAKPGVNIRDLNRLVVDYYREELPKHGLTEDVREYYYHSVSHHIGLDCHDADGGLGLILKEGNVISNEPGIYVADEGIGIRIEDDLLITKEGAFNLSKNIIKEVSDIENFMKH